MTGFRFSLPVAGSAVLVALLIVSGWHPYDRTTWLLEIFPILIALPILAASGQRFPLTTFLYGWIFLHATVLMLGGAYSYARVPLGFDLEHLLHLQRNPYDKVGHFLQGWVPALIAREILLRGGFLKSGKMLNFLCLCVVMFISASYELIEWGSAVALGQGADEFLGTQGDPWDTQSDMLFALIGGSLSLLLMSRMHDRALGRLATQVPATRG
jgi:putative membrane protein